MADYLSVPEVAESLGVSPKVVYGLVWSKQLASIKVGRLLRISKVALNDFVERQAAA